MQAAGYERHREIGDLLMANMSNIPKGARHALVHDFYLDAETDIALDPALSAQQNAARYYKLCRKAKSAREFLSAEIDKCESEIAYLESVSESLSRADSQKTVADIREEMVSGGYLRRTAQKQPTGNAAGKKKQKASADLGEPMRFVSSTGSVILAGRNNRQNDYLTLKFASKKDIWLHASKIPGSHVIIPCASGEPDSATLEEAAQIAAFLSKAKTAGKAPVDYTKVSHVKKPPGSKPGMVTYSDFKTILAVFDEKTIDAKIVR
jgi:predicted ribosome quality control (RQC) complex YloA/Tae2 family protein